DVGHMWELPDPAGFAPILKFLLRTTPLRIVRLRFTSGIETRYVWGKPDALELALSLRPNTYLSHTTVMHIHGLTENTPDRIYVNAEQTEKPRWDTTLTQAAVDSAFKRPQRVTNQVARYRGMTIYVLKDRKSTRL